MIDVLCLPLSAYLWEYYGFGRGRGKLFTVVETGQCPPRRWFERRISRKRPGYILTRHINPRYLTLEMLFPAGKPDALSRRQAERGFAEAARQGSVGVVLPHDFPFADLPPRWGMAVATPIPLYRRIAGPIALFAAEQMGISPKNLRVALIGRRFTEMISMTAQCIAAAVRTVTLDVGRDTEAACYGLRSLTGMPVSRQKAATAHIYVFFEDPGTAFSLPESALCLNFSGGHPAILGGITADGALLDPPRTLWRDWPRGCDRAALLSALCAQGSIHQGEIAIRGICRGVQNLPLPRIQSFDAG